MLEPFALDYDLVLWGLFGAVVLGIQNRWRHLGLWWFITIIPLLTYHQPFWYHYHPLIVIPAVWLGADGLGATLRYLNRRWRLATVWAPTPLLSGFLVIILFGLSVHLFPSKWDEVRDDVRRLTERSLGYQRVLNDLQAQLAASNPSSSAAETISPTQAIPQPFQPGSAATSIQPSANIWLYTDLPMYAFYSGLSIPPELAVISNKRVYGGNLTAADFREVFEKYQPQSVIVGRIRKFRNIFQADLDGDFEMLSKSRIDKNETVLYYQRLPTE